MRIASSYKAISDSMCYLSKYCTSNINKKPRNLPWRNKEIYRYYTK